MALNKTKSFQTGVDANYHKITKLDIDVLGGNINVFVSTFLSHEARETGKWPVETVAYNFSGADYFVETNQPQNAVELAYLKIKEKVEFFSDAVNC